MTQQHCGHECCPIEKRRAGKGDDGVIRCYPLEPCPHDTRRAPAPQQPDERDMKWRMWFVGDLVSALRWDAEHGNPSLFHAVDLAQRHLGEKIDKQPPAPAALDVLEGREDEIYTTLSVVQNTKERYEDNEEGTIEDALDDIRHHLEGALIDVQERKAALRAREVQGR